MRRPASFFVLLPIGTHEYEREVELIDYIEAVIKWRRLEAGQRTIGLSICRELLFRLRLIPPSCLSWRE